MKLLNQTRSCVGSHVRLPSRGTKRVLLLRASKERILPTSAKDAVELGTTQFEQREFRDALRLYRAAMDMQPSRDEARAAMYNAACAHVKLQQWKEATEAVKSAVNDYDLKVEVAQEVCL